MLPPTKRNEGGLSFQYFLPADWFALVSYNFLQNDEQKLQTQINNSARWR